MAPDNDFEPIVTERLVLRRSHAGDAPAIAAYRSDPEVHRYQGWERTDHDGVREEIEAMASRVPGEPGRLGAVLRRGTRHGPARRRRRSEPRRGRAERDQGGLHDGSRVPGARLRDGGGRRPDRLRVRGTGGRRGARLRERRESAVDQGRGEAGMRLIERFERTYEGETWRASATRSTAPDACPSGPA